MGSHAVLLSYRLGGTDGVSVEAAKWERALDELGFSVRRVAGAIGDAPRSDDIVLPGLGLDSTVPPERAELDTVVREADLVVVENVCSLPVNLDVARATRDSVVGHCGRVLFHHHDLPWQRAELTGIDGFPPVMPGALHVTINDRSRRELAARGMRAHTVRNAFDFDTRPGERAPTRRQLGFEHDDLVVLQPTRAIPRKEVSAGIRFVETLSRLVTDRRVRYWLTGPAEDGYGPTLTRALASAEVPVTIGRAARPADAYAAADAVVFPSSWEGFGNPVIESVVARRPLAVAGYPVLDEIVACGLRFFPLDEPGLLSAWLHAPDHAVLTANFERARRRFSTCDLPERIDEAFRLHGWTAW